MSFFTNIRADRFITELKEAKDVAAPATQKAIAKLRELGSGAIEPVTAALADADKIATVAYIEVLTGLVNQKTFPKFIEAMVTGSPRVVAGVAWALAVLVKWIPLIFLPLRALEARRTGRHLTHSGTIATVAVVLAVATWRYGLHWLDAFRPLARNAGLETRFALPSRLEQLGVPDDVAVVLFAVAFACAYA